MAIEHIRKQLTGDSPGKTIELNGYRIGPPDAEKKVYLQGAIHTDEQPGIMALVHLLPKLIAADERGDLGARFVLFPMVNPIGMGNIEFGMHQGRYDVVSGVNFNRGWPDLFGAIEDAIHGHLGMDGGENIQTIRRTIRSWLENRPIENLRQQLRQAVMLEAYDADYVLDLHCDDDALLHIFSPPHCNDVMQSLSDHMGGSAILTAEDSGGGSFDEVWSLPYIKASRKYPDLPIPIPVSSCTLELRGQADVFDELGARDANGLYGFFQDQGLINGNKAVSPEPTPSPTALNAMELLRVDRPGLLAYKVSLGERVSRGDVIADLICLDGPEAFQCRTPFRAGTDGMVISRNIRKYVWPGCSIAKIVGTEPLASRGDYLLDD